MRYFTVLSLFVLLGGINAIGQTAFDESNWIQPVHGNSVVRGSQITSDINRSLVFNGDGAYVEIPPSDNLDGLLAATIELWVKVESNDRNIIAITNDGSPHQHQTFQLTQGVPQSIFVVWNSSGSNTTLSADAIPLREWTHVAAVFDEAHMAIFINGIKKSEVLASGNMKNAQGSLRFGKWWSGDPAWFWGKMDEVRISNTARYFSNFTPLTRFEPDSATIGLWHFDEGEGNIILDATGNGHQGTPYNISWSDDVPPDVDLNRGLVAYYPFNGDANDATGNENDLTVYGAVPATDRFGNQSKSYHFRGSNYVSGTSSGSTENLTTVSVNAWIWLDANSLTDLEFVFTKNTPISTTDIALAITPAGNVKPHVWASGGWYNGLVGSTIVQKEQWHMITMTHDGNNLNVYVDGILDGTNAVAGPLRSITNTLNIGAYDPTDSANGHAYWFTGRIDDVRIYNRALADSEIQSLYYEGGYDPSLVAYYPFNGNANDESANDNDGTVHTSTLTTDRFGYSNRAYDFDGSESYIEVADHASLRPETITISAWIYPRTIDLRGIVYKSTFADATNEQYALDIIAPGKLNGGIKRNSSCQPAVGWVTATGTSLVSQNQWSHVSMTWDGSVLRSYINGEMIASNTSGPSGSIDDCSGGTLRLGLEWQDAGGHSFNGKLDDFRFYNRALSADEIQTLYQQERVVDTTTIWTLQLSASSGSASDDGNHIGIADDATDGFDQYFDDPEPPASPGDYIQLYFPHAEYEQPTGDNFTRDIRAVHELADTVMRFRFDVNTNISESNVSLSFSSDGRIPSGFGMVLKDLSSGARKNLKRDGMNYSFTSGLGGGTREFELLIGDSTAPAVAVMSPNGGEIIHSNSDYSVLWMASDGTGVDSVSIDYSNDAGASYARVSTVLGNAGISTWTTPAEYLTSNAVLKIQATDSMGNSAVDYSGNRFTIVGDSLATNFSAGWNLVGTALDPTNADPTSLFADDISGAFYVFDFSQSGGYSHPSSFVHGRGYWLGLLADQSADIRGAAVTDTNVLNLPQGFTMISNPLVVPLPVDSLVFARGDSAKAYADAVALGWIATGVQEYDNGTGSYASTDTLGIWQGAWLGVIEEDVQLIVTPPMLPAVGSDANAAQDSPSEYRLPRDWQVNIIAEGTHAQDRSLTFGVKPDASEGFDLRYDEPKPPVPPGGKYVQAFFMHPDWVPILGSRFTSDIQSPEGRKAWTFYVSASELMDITLSWNIDQILRDVPDSVKLELSDTRSGERIDMKTASSYEFSTKEARLFTINTTVLGANEDREMPTTFSLKQAYPNPFNPSTTLEYTLPEAVHVSLRIYNTLGEEVHTIVDEFKGAGYYSVLVDMNDLPSGVYMYRLQAGEFSEVKRMVLVR